MSGLIVRAMCVAGPGAVASWLLLAGSSPFSSWLTTQTFVTNVASAVNLPTTLFALSAYPGNAAPSDVAIDSVRAKRAVSCERSKAPISGRRIKTPCHRLRKAGRLSAAMKAITAPIATSNSQGPA